MTPSATEAPAVGLWDASLATDALSASDRMPGLVADPLNVPEDLWAQWVRKGQIHDSLVRERLLAAALFTTVAVLLGLAVATSLF